MTRKKTLKDFTPDDLQHELTERFTDQQMDQVLEAERLGYDSVWTAEAYGSDAVSTAAWMLAKQG